MMIILIIITHSVNNERVKPKQMDINMNKLKYKEGLQMQQFKRIAEISHYNYNYYVGFEKDLLFGKSDDYDTTEWWLISNGNFHYLGESYCNKNELLHLFDSVRT